MDPLIQRCAQVTSSAQTAAAALRSSAATKSGAAADGLGLSYGQQLLTKKNDMLISKKCAKNWLKSATNILTIQYTIYIYIVVY